MELITCLFLDKYGFQKFKPEVSDLLDYLTLISTLLGVVGSILIGFFFFSFQGILSQQQTWFTAIKEEINKLINILAKLPSDSTSLFMPLHECISFLQNKRLRDYPIFGDDWKIISNPVDIVVEKKLLGKHFLFYEMTNSLSKIEEYAGEIGVLKIATLLSVFLIKSIKKIFFLLLANIFVIFIFHMLKNSYNFHPVFLGSIMLLSLYFISTTIFEVLLHFNDYYRNYVPDREREES